MKNHFLMGNSSQESTDVIDIAQSLIYVFGTDDNYVFTDKVAEFYSMHEIIIGPHLYDVISSVTCNGTSCTV